MKDNLNIVIYGDPRTKKNSIRIVKCGSYHRVLPSKAYVQYEKEFVMQCKSLRLINKGIDYKCNIKCLYYMKTRRTVDLCNLLEGTCDCLVTSGVIQDDNSKIAYSHDGSRVLYDKDNPRVEITIEKLEV